MNFSRAAAAAVVIAGQLLAGSTMEAPAMNAMKIESPSFKHKGMMPPRFTCDGEDVNPALAIEGVPPDARSLALIMDDPDAPRGTWVHWLVWNIDPKTSMIAENTVPAGAMQGMNDFRRHDYGGPCPPSGSHRYFFRLYALREKLGLGPETTKARLEAAMSGLVIA